MVSGFDPARWPELCAEFEALLGLGLDAQAERLEVIGRSDPAAREMLEQLLAADATPPATLERLDAVFGVDQPGSRPRPQPDADLLGLANQTVGSFHIVEPLAIGGMGVVYRAIDTHLDRPVALKFLRPEQHLDEPARVRFLAEARAAGGLDHPNICSVYQAGELEDGRLFLAMPLYEGETLGARLAREGPLPLRAALDLARQMARGLEAAHRAGIVHRDLKPANAVVLRDGGLRILDFGIARIGEPVPAARQDRVGTLAYMAPEQLRGHPADSRTDLWALGAVLYEMLTGRRPFEGPRELATARAILHDSPPPPSTWRPEVPPEVDALVLGLLARDPADRRGPASAVGDTLAALAANLAGPAPSRPSAAQQPEGRRRFRRAAAAAAILVAATAGIAAWQLRPGAGERPDAPAIVAVLPFTQAAGAPEEGHLAIALPVELADDLSGRPGVAVPAWSSGEDLAWPDSTPSALVEAFQADALIGGEVSRVGDRVRFVVQLYDARRPGRTWARTYEGLQSSLYTLQAEAASDIAAALRLGRGSRAGRASAIHPEAWDLYLRGRAAHVAARPGALGPLDARALADAQSFYARAREMDPDLALARAHLAAVLLGLPPSDQLLARRDQARIEAEAALRLAPDLPQAHAALATYWSLTGDEVRAAAALEQALAGRPHDPELLGRLGEVLPRLGRWDEAVRAFDQATRHDPRNRDAHLRAALIRSRLRQYDEAIRHWDHVVALDGGEAAFPRIIRAFVHLRRGDAAAFDAGLRAVPLGQDAGGLATFAHWTAHRIQGRDAEALAVLDSARYALTADVLMYLPVSLMRAQTLENLGDTAAARNAYEQARRFLADSAAVHPQDVRIHLAQGLALAGLGRHGDALRLAQRALDLMPPLASNSIAATAFRGTLVEVYLRAGDLDRAFELLELLLALPAGREVSVPLLRLDPVFAPLRGDARYAALLARFAPGAPAP